MNNLKALIETLKNTPFILSDYVDMIPEEDMDQKRGENFWTVREHIVHLEYTQDIMYNRLMIFKNEEKPQITPYFPENDKVDQNVFETMDNVLESYKNKRDKQIELINTLIDADFQKEATHGEYKKYNLQIVLNHILFHDYWHLYRIEELWLTKDQYLSKG